MKHRPRTSLNVRDALLGLAGAALVMVLSLVMQAIHAETAGAHAPTRPCAAVARITGTTVDACRAARIRHADTHTASKLARACRIETDMPRRLCAAIATVIVQDNHPASWATDPALDELLDRESSHDPNAVNDRSDACGWWQRLVKKRLAHPEGGRGCPWKFIVLGWRGRIRVERVIVSDVEQARNGLKYIADRPGYGSPAAALAHHNRIGWY